MSLQYILDRMRDAGMEFQVSASVDLAEELLPEFYSLLDDYQNAGPGDNTASMALMAWLDMEFPDMNFRTVPFDHIRFNTDLVLHPRIEIGERVPRHRPEHQPPTH